MFTNWLRRRGIIRVEAVCARPAAGVSTNTVSIENLLRRAHHLVDGVAARVCGVGIAPHLDSLDFYYLLRQRLFRRKNVIDLFIAGVRYIRQTTP
ncbi:hypothetical protein [Mycobacterium avium]|uniref:hypothetical protein n=1 Tax=Mycobacterium avium TaxID=1764 RepID=UPI001F3942A3|nr:hypothetical protein [Mycobacterium avium]